jgi:protease-4
MISEAELIADRRQLRRKVTFWRVAAVVLLLAAVAAIAGTQGGFQSYEKYRDHVARVSIDGFISGDQPTLDMLEAIDKSDAVKGVILRIDSPGGTTAGAEALYDALIKVGKKKPIVAVMDTVAASGGYITAIAADHIVARGNTITGSIGVIFQFPEVSKLLDTLGIKMEEIKSGELKAEPTPYKPVSDKARAVANIMVQDSFAWFTGLVAERRGLPMPQVLVLSDGRVYTGRQAVKEKLVDELGGEEKAVDWLVAEKKVSKDLPILDWEPKQSDRFSSLGFSIARSVMGAAGLDWLVPSAARPKLDGLLAVWHPDL